MQLGGLVYWQQELTAQLESELFDPSQVNSGSSETSHLNEMNVSIYRPGRLDECGLMRRRLSATRHLRYVAAKHAAMNGWVVMQRRFYCGG